MKPGTLRVDTVGDIALADDGGASSPGVLLRPVDGNVDHVRAVAPLLGKDVRLVSATSASVVFQAEINRLDKLAGDLQNLVRDELTTAVRDIVGPGVRVELDGGASDGDELDFTRAEIHQAVALIEEHVEELRQRVRRYEDAFGALPEDLAAPSDAPRPYRGAITPGVKSIDRVRRTYEAALNLPTASTFVRLYGCDCSDTDPDENRCTREMIRCKGRLNTDPVYQAASAAMVAEIKAGEK